LRDSGIIRLSVMNLRFLAAYLALALPAWAGEWLTVVAPEDRAVLRGGSVATIAWTSTAPLPPGVVEWEAFLSVDGGRYFATRITPHLDIDIRSFEWRVPNVSSNDVRLLLRVGDEREEVSIDVPLRLSIVAELDIRPSFARIAKGRGESARPGDLGVAAWVTGDRAGRELGYERAPVDSAIDDSSVGAQKNTHTVAEGSVVPSARPRPSSLSAIARAPRCCASSPLLARDILVLVSRRNI
jgi:hypothetical protein